MDPDPGWLSGRPDTRYDGSPVSPVYPDPGWLPGMPAARCGRSRHLSGSCIRHWHVTCCGQPCVGGLQRPQASPDGLRATPRRHRSAIQPYLHLIRSEWRSHSGRAPAAPSLAFADWLIADRREPRLGSRLRVSHLRSAGSAPTLFMNDGRLTSTNTRRYGDGRLADRDRALPCVIPWSVMPCVTTQECRHRSRSHHRRPDLGRARQVQAAVRAAAICRGRSEGQSTDLAPPSVRRAGRALRTSGTSSADERDELCGRAGRALRTSGTSSVDERDELCGRARGHPSPARKYRDGGRHRGARRCRKIDGNSGRTRC